MGERIRQKLTQEEKENSRQVIDKYNPAKQIEWNRQTLLNADYLFLQSIYYDLELDNVCRQIAQKYEFEYDLNEILSRLLYLRIRHPTSKKGTFEHTRDLLEPARFQSHQIYRALGVLNGLIYGWLRPSTRFQHDAREFE